MRATLESRLALLNLFRWVRAHLISWGLLSFIYSLTVTLILEPFLERFLELEGRLPFWGLWATTCALLLVPAVLEFFPAPGFQLNFGFSALRSLGQFKRLYLTHEFRRAQTWITLGIVVGATFILPMSALPLWVLFALIPAQRALYSIHQWRRLALSFQPEQGAQALVAAITLSQAIQLLIVWVIVGIVQVLIFENWPPGIWLQFGPAVLGGAIASGATALEGDSGRPWMVNFFAMAAGILGGFLCLASPWFLLAVGYFYTQMKKMVADRLHSVEHQDEDIIIS